MKKVNVLIFFAFDKISEGDINQTVLHECLKSLRSAYPDASLDVLTNNNSLPFIPADLASPIVHEIESSELLLERARLNLSYLSEAPASEHVLFLDYDMVALRPFSWIWDREVDAVLTYRQWNKQQPINGGFLGFPAEARSRSLRFYQRVVENFEAISDLDERRWYGDQIALIQSVGEIALTGELHQTAHGEQIRILECDRVNFTPFDGVAPDCLPEKLNASQMMALARKDLIHFKGPRKTYVPEFVNSIRQAG